jgi:phosphoribosylaminoimidazolecarboxamide formyltransferase/IMP cyclohydrolase
MSHPVAIRRALLSVSDKTDLIPFARRLDQLGVQIISTGGTAAALAAAGIAVTPIQDVTGFPEMMDGRVKTLHPAVHGALLALRDNDEHIAAMREHGITPIDLVCINLYPFERTVRESDVTEAEAIEQIDIGGPAMIRSSAKNHRFVTVVTDPGQYDRVVSELNANEGSTTIEMRRELAAAAFTRTAEYDTAISAWMSSQKPKAFPAMLRLVYAHKRDLRYGENPHQAAALYADPTFGEANVVSADVLHGKPLSYNNINDAAAALELVRDLTLLARDRVAAAVIKHTNPCGAAVADDPADAFERAYAGDPMAAYGGILALSRPVTSDVASCITDGQKFFEVIVAPAFDDDALERLSERWANVRLLVTAGIDAERRRGMSYRSVPGGLLAQERDTQPAETTTWRHAAGPEPDQALIESAAVLWTIVKHVTSNAITIGANGQLLGAGAGQMDRVASCRIAVEKAGERIGEDRPIIAASDAFFPFDDGPRLLIDAGVRCIVHPGGSKRDQDTLDLCDERGVTCLLTGVRHFRH